MSVHWVVWKEDHPLDNTMVGSTPTIEDVEKFSADLPTLPPGWQAMWDSTAGSVYFGNLVTKVGSRLRSTITFTRNDMRLFLTLYC